jgi:hypothetical protein
MRPTPHLDKLNAALVNALASADDKALLTEAKAAYEAWIAKTEALKATGAARIAEMVGLLNAYKDKLEVELISKRGSRFIKRQKGQLKLDSSVIEEFLPLLIRPEIINGLSHTRFSRPTESIHVPRFHAAQLLWPWRSTGYCSKG